MIRALLIAVLSWLCFPAHAASVKPGNTAAQLVSERDAIVAGERFTVALQLNMDAGWHTYWRNPGDSGLPTKITWQLPPGFSAGELQWPYPERIPAGPFANFGYEHEVLLLAELTAPTDLKIGEQVTLAARADWLECKEICIPQFAQLSLQLPVAAAAAPIASLQRAFDKTRSAFSGTLERWEVAAAVEGSDLLLRFMPPADSSMRIKQVSFFPFAEKVVRHASEAAFSGDGAGFRLRIARPANAAALQQVAGVAVAEPGWNDGGLRAVEISLPLSAKLPPAQPSTLAPAASNVDGLSLALALVFALVGGVILNVMPCVFPVLGIKVMGFVQHAGEHRRLVSQQGWLFTLGVVLSFLLLAALMLALRGAGNAVGWGFQLQSPLVVSLLAALFFALALNLSGVFEIGARVQQLAGSVGSRHVHLNAFLSGVLAALVATPCTAPFMGAAVGYTLTQPAPLVLLVFGVLGLGMALPVLALAMFPAWLRRLPRPGKWMETFKQVMAFPLYATVIWLIWVLGEQTDNSAVLRLLLALLLIGIAAWCYGRWALSRRGVAIAVSALLVLGAGFTAWPRTVIKSNEVALADESGWQSWSPQKMAELRAQGKPVFVDFTAAWCITCQVNKRVTLSDADVVRAFARKGVTLMRADWTQRDAAITAQLAALGRNAVPVYALYRDGAAPQLLPEVLTPTLVLDALANLPDQAASKLSKSDQPGGGTQ